MLEDQRINLVLVSKDRCHNHCSICNQDVPLTVQECCGVKVSYPYTCAYRQEILIVKDEYK